MHSQVFESDLNELCQLLGLPLTPDMLPIPRLEHFERWKPIAEQAAEELRDDAGHIALLIEKIGKDTSDDYCRAKALWICGNMLYRLNRPSRAIERFKACDTIYGQLGETLEPARMSVGWIAALIHSDTLQDAVDLGQRISEILRCSDLASDIRRLAFVQNNLGLAYQRLGEYETAIEHFRLKLSWAFAQDTKTIDTVIEVGSSLTCIGIAQTFLGQFIEASNSYQRAREWLLRYKDDAECQIEIGRVDLHVLWLETLRRVSNKKVEKAIEIAFESRAKLGKKSSNDLLAQIDLFAATWWIHTCQYQRIDYGQLEAQLVHYKESGLTFEVWATEFLLGQLDLLHRKLPQQALQRFAKIEQQSSQAGNPAVAYHATVWKSRAQRDLGQVEDAQRSLEQALLTTEVQANSIKGATYRIGFLDDKLIGFQDLVALHISIGRPASAFSVVERTRAFLLREKWQETEAYWQHEASLNSALLELPRDTLLIVYTQIANQLYAFVGAHNLPIYAQDLGAMPNQDELTDLFEQLHSIQNLALTSNAIGQTEIAQQVRRCQTKLRQWYSKLIAPLNEQIKTREKILVSPDGCLNFVPFTCLFDGQAYLAETRQIVMTPSFAIWHAMRHKRVDQAQPPKKRVVIGCDVVEHQNNQLPFAVAEARAVAAILGIGQNQNSTSDALFVSEDATRAKIIPNLNGSGLIYIAAHGRHRADIPSLSYIELKDSRLRMADVMKLALSGADVILSACDTAHGHMTANMTLGMPWAFLKAGARTVLASQWQIDDRMTHSFMTTLMRHYQLGHSLSIALNLTQREFIHSNDLRAHPYFWGFTTPISIEE